MKLWLAIALLLTLALGRAHAEVERYAVIVGDNAGAADEQRLRFAETDAQHVAELLGEVGGVPDENQVVLRGKSAEQMRRALIATNERIRSGQHAGRCMQCARMPPMGGSPQHQYRQRDLPESTRAHAGFEVLVGRVFGCVPMVAYAVLGGKRAMAPMPAVPNRARPCSPQPWPAVRAARWPMCAGRAVPAAGA